MEITVRLPRPHEAQRRVINDKHRFVVLCCGRRWGKDVLLQRGAIKHALAGGQVGFFAPTYRNMLENWRSIEYALGQSAKLANKAEFRIETITNGLIEFWSLDNPDSARGREYSLAQVNEAAHVKSVMDTWSMVIRPMLAKSRGRAMFASTPNGLNDFYQLWRMADDNPEEWSRHKSPTADNPFIPATEIEALKKLPERVYRQEILADFLSDGAYFQGVDAAATIEHPDAPGAHSGHYLVMGVDWALSHDYTVLTVGCRDCCRVVDWDRFNQVDFTYQRERLLDMARRWNVAGVLPETNSIGEPNIEIIQQHVNILRGPDNRPGFTTTATSKPALIQRLASGIEHDGLKLPLDYADELRAYQVELSLSGHHKFSAPSGAHDDRVMSLALTWYAMTDAGGWYAM